MGQFWQIFACPEFIEWVSEFIIIFLFARIRKGKYFLIIRRVVVLLAIGLNSADWGLAEQKIDRCPKIYVPNFRLD